MSADCKGCKHYEASAVFELCLHSSSAYTVADKADFHTIGHMRGVRGACGDTALHFSPGESSNPRR